MRGPFAAAPLVAGVLALGCGEANGRLGTEAQPIQGGYADTADTAVVGLVLNDAGVGTCSGSLIGQNLVLTARHCVSKIENEIAGGGVSCAKTTFGPLFSPDSFRVTTGDVAFLAAKYVQEVIGVPGDDTHLCGQDVALLVLLENVADDDAVPILPRVDSAIAPGDVYSAVGFGAIDGAGTGAGTRRRLDDLMVDCVGEGCSKTLTRSTEWIGSPGVCSGDSGGPALDADGRVIGVTSRGPMGCGATVYGSVLAWGDWMKEAALHAADLGGYPPPPWANGHPTDPEYNFPVGDACTAPKDCASAQCLGDAGRHYCTRACTDLAECPTGFVCDAARGNVCAAVRPKAGDPPVEGSCGLSPGRASCPLWMLVLAALLVARRRGVGVA